MQIKNLNSPNWCLLGTVVRQSAQPRTFKNCGEKRCYKNEFQIHFEGHKLDTGSVVEFVLKLHPGIRRDKN
uniref:Uncharacterized protein n=1 Tax=Amphiprion ocellaris TaxID=80972 RepID=A0A3Q1AMI8_AMPOC